MEIINTLIVAGADLMQVTTADTEEGGETDTDFPMMHSMLPGGLSPMPVAETVGGASERDRVVAHLTAAIARRAL